MFTVLTLFKLVLCFKFTHECRENSDCTHCVYTISPHSNFELLFIHLYIINTFGVDEGVLVNLTGPWGYIGLKPLANHWFRG